METEWLPRSVKALLHGVPGISLPPLPSGGAADAVTFLGLVFPLDGSPPAAKIYFAPGGGTPRLPSEMPDALRQSMESAIHAYRGEAWRLHDASVERARNGEIAGRLLWALRSTDRADDGRWPRLVTELLADLGHPGLADPLLRLNARLRELLRSELAPLCQLGGFLAPDGSLSRLKANFDADTSRSGKRTEYQPERARAATRFLLEAGGAEPSALERMLSRLEAATQGACHVHSWGFHAEGRRVGNLKIYVRDERTPERAFSSIFREFSRELANGHPEAPLSRPDTLLGPLGWRFHGFYAEVEASSFRTLKFYFRAPPERPRETSERHPPARTEAGAGHGMARRADFQVASPEKENP